MLPETQFVGDQNPESRDSIQPQGEKKLHDIGAPSNECGTTADRRMELRPPCFCRGRTETLVMRSLLPCVTLPLLFRASQELEVFI